MLIHGPQRFHGSNLLVPRSPAQLAYCDKRIALKKADQSIPANDAWIAALALEHRLPVLSRDQHFDVVRGVHRRGW